MIYSTNKVYTQFDFHEIADFILSEFISKLLQLVSNQHTVFQKNR